LVEKYALFIENLQIIKEIPKLGGSAKLPFSHYLLILIINIKFLSSKVDNYQLNLTFIK